MTSTRRRATVVAASALALSACGLPFVGGEPQAETTPTQVAVSAAATCAEKILEPMDREQRVGQLLLVGVPVTSNRDAVPWLSQFHLGGVVLTGSITTSVAPAAKAVTRLRDASPDDPRPYVAAIQEGGEVQTLRGRGFTAMPSADRQTGASPQEVIDAFVTMARSLSEVGVNLTLSPVADTLTTDDDGNPLAADQRSFGSDPNTVATQVHLTVQAFGSQKISTTLKHFPGLGRVTADPDDSDDATDDTMAIDDAQLVPFVTGIEAGADLVMMSSATYPQLDPDAPAVFSRKVVTDLLRRIVNFDGVVLSSDLSADGTIESVPVADRGVRFLEAGGDMMLSLDAGAAADLIDGLVAKDSSDPEFAKLVDAAALRILTAKADRGVVTCE